MRVQVREHDSTGDSVVRGVTGTRVYRSSPHRRHRAAQQRHKDERDAYLRVSRTPSDRGRGTTGRVDVGENVGVRPFTPTPDSLPSSTLPYRPCRLSWSVRRTSYTRKVSSGNFSSFLLKFVILRRERGSQQRVRCGLTSC